MSKFFPIKNALILFSLGAILAPIGDIAHVLTQTTIYPLNFRHLFNIIPFWVPIQFGLVTILIGILHHYLIKKKSKVNSLYKCSLSAISLISCYCVSGFLPFQPWVSIILITVLCSINYYYLTDFSRESLNLLFLAISISIVATLIELFLTKIGIFQYQIIPYWLPLLYIHASLTVGSFTSFLNQN